tara:strand:+ start:2634 stop:3755 length:1122 start_codon:yes stop_codon:yes gene_type:complete
MQYEIAMRRKIILILFKINLITPNLNYLMRIVHVVRMWPTNSDPQHGSFIKAHVIATQKLGHDIRVVSLGPTPLKDEEISNYHSNTLKGPIGWRTKLNLVKKAIHDLNGCDMLHIHGGSADTAYILIRLKSKYGKSLKYAVTEHQSHWFYGAPLGAKVTAKLADLRSAVSPALSEIIKKNGKTTFIPNILQKPTESSIKTIYKRKEKNHRDFLFVGDIVDTIKGISGILKAWEIHSNTFKKDKLTIVGDGPDKQKLKNRFCDLGRLEWKGRFEVHEVHEEMFKNDILIVNSKIETFSMVIGEALERGMYVICSPCKGPQGVYPKCDSLNFRKSFLYNELANFMSEAKRPSEPIFLDDFRENKIMLILENWYSS